VKHTMHNITINRCNVTRRTTNRMKENITINHKASRLHTQMQDGVLKHRRIEGRGHTWHDDRGYHVRGRTCYKDRGTREYTARGSRDERIHGTRAYTARGSRRAYMTSIEMKKIPLNQWSSLPNSRHAQQPWSCMVCEDSTRYVPI